MMAVFSKCERLRHIGHLDIMRAMQRALRRSGLPVGYSNGFNPHILLTFASALSVGVIGENEILETSLKENVTPEVFLEAMNKALPPDMQLKSARVLEDRAPSLMSSVQAADYTINLLCDDERAAKLLEALPGFMQQEDIQADRKTKSGVKQVNIRPLIFALSAENGCIHGVLALTEGASCKVDMLMTALCVYAGVEVPRMLVTRTKLLGRNEAGELTELEKL